jgi:hypothetical protein
MLVATDAAPEGESMTAQHHRDLPLRWSLRGLRRIIGQEIAWITGESFWAEIADGDQATWRRLLTVSRRRPRMDVWTGPWLLFSDPDALRSVLMAAGNPPPVAIREASWYWRALGWGRYAGPTTWAVLAYLEEVWPPELSDAMLRMPCHPVRDWLRLERRVAYLRAAVDGASHGDTTVPWGIGRIDCGPLLPRGDEWIEP